MHLKPKFSLPVLPLVLPSYPFPTSAQTVRPRIVSIFKTGEVELAMVAVGFLRGCVAGREGEGRTRTNLVLKRSDLPSHTQWSRRGCHDPRVAGPPI